MYSAAKALQAKGTTSLTCLFKCPGTYAQTLNACGRSYRASNGKHSERVGFPLTQKCPFKLIRKKALKFFGRPSELSFDIGLIVIVIKTHSS